MQKIILLFCISFFITRTGTSQNLINSSKREIYEYLNKKGIKNSAIESGKREEDGMPWIAFSDETAKNVYFFDSRSICIYYRRVYPIIFFDATIKFINKNYKLIGDSLWQDSSKTGSFVLSIVKQDKIFMLDESPAKPKMGQ